MSNQYISNKDFYNSIVEYKKEVKRCAELGLDKPVIPEFCAKCIMMIAQKYGTKSNYARYTYLDEMISDGIEHSIRYFDNFNPEITQNPFAYFTQIIHYAFLRRINGEKTQFYTAYKVAESGIMCNLTDQIGTLEETQDFSGMGDVLGDNITINEFVKKYEDTISKKKPPSTKKPRGMDMFL